MTEPGQHTYREILSQPTVWRDAARVFADRAPDLKRWLAQERIEQVVLTGCGSTYYLSLIGAALFRALSRLPTWAFPASELLDPDAAIPPGRKTLVVAVSRSGETTETTRAIEALRRGNGRILAVTCYGESTLAGLADLTLALNSAREESVAQTRSFSSMALATQGIAALIAGEDTTPLEQLAAACERLLAEHVSQAQSLGEDRRIERFFFLGSGPLYGVACEAMLKMKEMSLAYSEAYHTLEFRHGPMSMVNDRSLVVGLLSDSGARNETAVLREMHDKGARVLALAPDAQANDLSFADVVPIQAAVPAWARPVLYLPVLQLMAYHRAITNRQNPDRPENLSAVISLDDLQDWGS